MTDEGTRFCPRCGTALVAGMPFCPKCGFNSADIAEPRDVHDSDVTSPGESIAMARADDAPRTSPPSRNGSFLLGAVIIAAGLVALGLLMRPQTVAPTSGPGAAASGPGGAVEPGGSQVAPSAPIVGLTIQSPRDGAVVATKDVTIIGIAPPGLTITRDVSFGLDQHATVDGTGHWAMSVGLNQGQNDLVFRIGDDRSTEQRLRVTFAPAQS
jgi:hypothetical protein